MPLRYLLTAHFLLELVQDSQECVHVRIRLKNAVAFPELFYLAPQPRPVQETDSLNGILTVNIRAVIVYVIKAYAPFMVSSHRKE